MLVVMMVAALDLLLVAALESLLALVLGYSLDKLGLSLEPLLDKMVKYSHH
jgi:hypothetical protein